MFRSGGETMVNALSKNIRRHAPKKRSDFDAVIDVDSRRASPMASTCGKCAAAFFSESMMPSK